MAQMKYGSIAGLAKPVSRLIQGVNGARSRGEVEGYTLLDACFERGCNGFDTGRVYGPSDKFLGAWIASRGIREQVIILGKGAHHDGNRQRVTPEDIRDDLAVSLRELATDMIDLYVLHRDDPSKPVEPIVDCLNELIGEGKISAFGASNWTHERIAEANAYAAANCLTPFALTNPNYSLAVQVEEPWANCISISGEAGSAAREWYRENKMPVFAWSSLAAGFLSGRITRDNADQLAPDLPLVARCYYSEDNFARLERAQEFADQIAVTVPQVALAFLFNQGLDFYALVGVANGDEMQNNIDALDLELSPNELRYLDLQTDDFHDPA